MEKNASIVKILITFAKYFHQPKQTRQESHKGKDGPDNTDNYEDEAYRSPQVD